MRTQIDRIIYFIPNSSSLKKSMRTLIKMIQTFSPLLAVPKSFINNEDNEKDYEKGQIGPFLPW